MSGRRLLNQRATCVGAAIAGMVLATAITATAAAGQVTGGAILSAEAARDVGTFFLAGGWITPETPVAPGRLATAIQPTAVQPTGLAAPSYLAVPGPGSQDQPRRHWRRGAKIGAVVGGLGGLGFGGLIALMCRIESGSCDAAIPAVAVFGVLSGAVAGAILGAAVPQDTTVHVAGERPPPGRRIGSASLSAGAVHATVEGGPLGSERATGAAARFNLYAELKPWLGLGPEIGTAYAGDGQVRHIALALRLSRERGTISPYFSGNLGAYETTAPSLEFLGGAASVGVRWMPATGRRFLDIDVRHARNVQNIEPMRMFGLYIGGGTYW